MKILISTYKPITITIVFGLTKFIINTSLNVAESAFVVAKIGLDGLC